MHIADFSTKKSAGANAHTRIYMQCMPKATADEKKDATEALAKYDVLTDDDQRRRFWVKSTHIK